MSRAHYRRVLQASQEKQLYASKQTQHEEELRRDEQYGNLDQFWNFKRKGTSEDYAVHFNLKTKLFSVNYKPLLLNIFTPIYVETITPLSIPHNVYANLMLFGELFSDLSKLKEHINKVLYCSTPSDDVIHVVIRTHGTETSYTAHDRNGVHIPIDRAVFDQLIIDRLLHLGFKHVVIIDNTCRNSDPPSEKLYLLKAESNHVMDHLSSLRLMDTDVKCKPICEGPNCPAFRKKYLPLSVMPIPTLLSKVENALTPLSLLDALIAVDDIFTSQSYLFQQPDHKLIHLRPIDIVTNTDHQHVLTGVVFEPSPPVSDDSILHIRTKLDGVQICQRLYFGDNYIDYPQTLERKGWHNILLLTSTPKNVTKKQLMLFGPTLSASEGYNFDRLTGTSDSEEARFAANIFYDITSINGKAMLPEYTVSKISITTKSHHCVDQVLMSPIDYNNHYYPLFFPLLHSLCSVAVGSQNYLALLASFILTIDEFNSKSSLSTIYHANMFDATNYATIINEGFSVVEVDGAPVRNLTKPMVTCPTNFSSLSDFKFVTFPEYKKVAIPDSTNQKKQICNITYTYYDELMLWGWLKKTVNKDGYCYCCDTDKVHTPTQTLNA